MDDRPLPPGSVRLFGLADRRLDLVLSLTLVAVILVSRIAVFPVSIWEQDEASFAASVVDYDPTDNRPHPPWFPLWIAMGGAMHGLGLPPAAAFQIVSVVFSVWLVFPLTWLWSMVLPRRLAVGAAVLFLVAPGPWFLSGRAFCGTSATALLVGGLSFWAHADSRPKGLATGSLLAALAVLVRPQFAVAVLGAMVLFALRTPRGHRWRIVLPLTAVVAVGVLVLVVSGGGVSAMLAALSNHMDYHASRLDAAEHGFATSGLSRCLGHPVVAALWVGLAAIGAARLVRERRWRSVSPVLLGALLPLLLVIHGLSDPQHARYALPVLALTTGLVVLGLGTLAGRRTGLVVAATVTSAMVAAGPQLMAYRSVVSPPIAAIEEAFFEAGRRDGVVVADRTLHAFFVLRRLTHPSGVPVLFDHMIENGFAPPPPPGRTVYVFDAGRGTLLESFDRRREFSCSIPLVRTLAQDRFLDLTVASGAVLRAHPDSRGPLILID